MDNFTPVVHQEWIKYKKTPENTFSRKYFLVLIDNRVELKENDEDFSKPKKTLPITDIGSSKFTDKIVIITYLKDRKWHTMYFHCVSAARAQIINQYILQAMNYNKFIPNKLNFTENQERPNERDTLSPLKKTLSYGANIKSKNKLKSISLHSEPMLPEIKKPHSPDLPHSGRRKETFTRIDDSPKTNKEARVISPRSLPKRPRPKTKLERSFKENKSKLVPLNIDDPSFEFLNHSTPNSTSSLVQLPTLSLSSPESNQIFPQRSNSNPSINSTISQPNSPISMTPLSGYFSLNPSYQNDKIPNNLFNVSENPF